MTLTGRARRSSRPIASSPPGRRIPPAEDKTEAVVRGSFRRASRARLAPSLDALRCPVYLRVKAGQKHLLRSSGRVSSVLFRPLTGGPRPVGSTFAIDQVRRRCLRRAGDAVIRFGRVAGLRHREVRADPPNCGSSNRPLCRCVDGSGQGRRSRALMSKPMQRRFRALAASAVVPDPMKGSRMTSPSRLESAMHRPGSASGNSAPWPFFPWATGSVQMSVIRSLDSSSFSFGPPISGLSSFHSSFWNNGRLGARAQMQDVLRLPGNAIAHGLRGGRLLVPRDIADQAIADPRRALGDACGDRALLGVGEEHVASAVSARLMFGPAAVGVRERCPLRRAARERCPGSACACCRCPSRSTTPSRPRLARASGDTGSRWCGG